MNPAANQKTKRYIVRRYVLALSPVDALLNERVIQPDDVWLDEKQPEKDRYLSYGL